MLRPMQKQQRTLTVCLIGDPPSEKFYSMGIYADALERALLEHGKYAIVRFRWQDEPVYKGKIWSIYNLYRNRFVRYPRQLAGVKADIYHILDHSYAHLARKLPLERTVVTCHDLMPLMMKEYRASLGGRMLIWLFRYSLRSLARVRHIISISNFTKQCLCENHICKSARISTVHYGIDAMFSEKHPRRRGTHGRKPVPMRILVVGATQEPYKNMDTILKAFSIVIARNKVKTVLVKVGAAFSAEQNRFIERAGIDSHIEFIGQYTHRQMPDLYTSVDLLLMPSLCEGFGMPVLEAMSCGVPVVTSRRGSIPEVAGEAALYVDPEDPEDIANGVERTIDEPALRKQMVRAGLKQASHFSWQRTARETASVYQQLTQQSGAGI